MTKEPQPSPPIESSYARGDRVIEGTEDWHIVLTEGVFDWEWAEFRAWYSPSERRYFWGWSSGCSCNSYDESFSSKAEFEDGDRDDMVRALRGFMNGVCDGSPDDTARAVSKARRYKEPKHRGAHE